MTVSTNPRTVLQHLVLPFAIAGCIPGVSDHSATALPPDVATTENPEVAGAPAATQQDIEITRRIYNFALLFASANAASVQANVDGQNFPLQREQTGTIRHWFYEIPLDDCRSGVTYYGRASNAFGSRQTPHRTIPISPGVYVKRVIGATRAKPGANNPGILSFGPSNTKTWDVFDFFHGVAGPHQVTLRIPVDEPSLLVEVENSTGTMVPVPIAPGGMVLPISCGSSVKLRATYSGTGKSSVSEDVSFDVHRPNAPIQDPHSNPSLGVNRPEFPGGPKSWETRRNGKKKQVLAGSARESGADGVGLRSAAPVTVGGDQVGGREDRV